MLHSQHYIYPLSIPDRTSFRGSRDILFELGIGNKYGYVPHFVGHTFWVVNGGLGLIDQIISFRCN